MSFARCYCKTTAGGLTHLWNTYTGRDAHEDNDVIGELACPRAFDFEINMPHKRAMYGRWALQASVNPEAYLGLIMREAR